MPDAYVVCVSNKFKSKLKLKRFKTTACFSVSDANSFFQIIKNELSKHCKLVFADHGPVKYDLEKIEKIDLNDLAEGYREKYDLRFYFYKKPSFEVEDEYRFIFLPEQKAGQGLNKVSLKLDIQDVNKICKLYY